VNELFEHITAERNTSTDCLYTDSLNLLVTLFTQKYE